MPAEGLEPPTNGLQNRCSTTELSRRPRRAPGRALRNRQLYRSGWPQSTDGSPVFTTVTHGTGPPPPGLHRGKVAAGSGDASGEEVFGAGAAGSGVAGGAVGAAPVGHCCTLIGEPLPLGSRADTSFSGTGAEPFGSVRSSQ